MGIFPNRAVTIRLVGPLLQELHEDWMVTKRYFSRESMAKLLGETHPS